MGRCDGAAVNEAEVGEDELACFEVVTGKDPLDRESFAYNIIFSRFPIGDKQT